MTKITLALLSALAIGGISLPAQASDWTAQGNPAHPSEAGPGPAANPIVGGGWALAPTGEAGGSFDARYAAPLHGGGQSGIVSGEAAGSFDRATSVKLGVSENAMRVLAALAAVDRG